MLQLPIALLFFASTFQGKNDNKPEVVTPMRVKMYFIPISAFVRYDIDTSNIKIRSDQQLVIAKPKQFLKKFEKSLGLPIGKSDSLFAYNSVRVLYDISYAGGARSEIIVDVYKHLLYNGKLYYVSDNLLYALLAPLGRKQLKDLNINKQKNP